MSKISIITTVFNRTCLLRKAIISLTMQSFQPFELILSDDGSEENVPEMIEDLIPRCGFKVIYVKQSHQGFRLAKCRNNGVLNSSGDILCFFDQDLVLTCDLLKTYKETVRKNRFVSGYPIRLTPEQSFELSEEVITQGDYRHIFTTDQTDKIKRQFRKDYISHILNKVGLEKAKPKLRGGASAINREDYFAINGYDEKFQGWGNEDDDIRRRLYKLGVKGYNPTYDEYPVHLYHEPNHDNGFRVNQEYNNIRIAEIAKGDYRAKRGLDNPLGDEKLEIIELN